MANPCCPECGRSCADEPCGPQHAVVRMQAVGERVKEMRAAALWVRDAFDPYAVARVIDGNYVAICAAHDEPALICRRCDWLDAGTPELAALVVALLNARNPLRTLLELMATRFAVEGPEPRGAIAYSYALKTARALRGELEPLDRPEESDA